MTGTAPPIAIRPICTEYAFVAALIVESAFTRIPPIVPPEPIATLPISATVSPEMFPTAIAAPTATAPPPPPIAFVLTVRFAIASTVSPPTARGTDALLSMCARWLAESFTTTT